MKSELIRHRGDKMVVLNVKLDNLYGFHNFEMNLTYPKKIKDSSLDGEHLLNRPNFRYKQVNILMGANATGKTTFGRILMKIFNFLDKRKYSHITDIIGDRSRPASFVLDMASKKYYLYRIACTVSPGEDGTYTPECVRLEIRRQYIRVKDSYESCLQQLLAQPYTPAEDYLEELMKLERLDWLFEYPEDTGRVLHFPKDEPKFQSVLEHILKALDPSIRSVEASQDVENAYVVRLQERAVVLQDGELFTTQILSSGTKAGVEVAKVISALMHGGYSFYYCDEKFPYIHSDLEKAILSLMIDFLQPNDQLFFTTHNTDILDLNLPRHAFTFLRKHPENPDCPIDCVSADSLLKRNTDSLKNAVENDLFACSPSVDLVYEIADL